MDAVNRINEKSMLKLSPLKRSLSLCVYLALQCGTIETVP